MKRNVFSVILIMGVFGTCGTRAYEYDFKRDKPVYSSIVKDIDDNIIGVEVQNEESIELFIINPFKPVNAAAVFLLRSGVCYGYTQDLYFENQLARWLEWRRRKKGIFFEMIRDNAPIYTNEDEKGIILQRVTADDSDVLRGFHKICREENAPFTDPRFSGLILSSVEIQKSSVTVSFYFNPDGEYKIVYRYNPEKAVWESSLVDTAKSGGWTIQRDK